MHHFGEKEYKFFLNISSRSAVVKKPSIAFQIKAHIKKEYVRNVYILLA